MPARLLTKADIEANIRVDPIRGCWLWTGAVNSAGYGYKGRWTNLAHKRAYLLWKGEVPKGLQLDHRCSVKACCNPDHLKPAPRGLNTQLAYIEKHKQMPWKTLRVARWMHNEVKERMGY